MTTVIIDSAAAPSAHKLAPQVFHVKAAGSLINRGQSITNADGSTKFAVEYHTHGSQNVILNQNDTSIAIVTLHSAWTGGDIGMSVRDKVYQLVQKGTAGFTGTSPDDSLFTWTGETHSFSGADLHLTDEQGTVVATFMDNQNTISGKTGIFETHVTMSETELEWVMAGGLGLGMLLQIKRSGGKKSAVAPPPLFGWLATLSWGGRGITK